MADQLPEVQEVQISSKVEMTMDEHLSARTEAEELIVKDTISQDGEDLEQDSDSIVTQKRQQLLAKIEAQAYAKEPQKYPRWEKASCDEDGGYTLINKAGNEISKPPKTIRIDSTIDTLDAIAENSTTPQDIQTRAREISANFKKHLKVLVNGEELDYDGYKLKLAAGELKREDVQFRLYVKEKTEPTISAELTAAEPEETPAAETLKGIAVDTIYKCCEQSGLSPKYADEFFPLFDQMRRSKKIDKELPDIMKKIGKIKQTFGVDKEKEIKFLQAVFSELTGKKPPEQVENPLTFYSMLLEDKVALEKMAESFPYDPNWKAKLSEFRDKKGIQIALGALSVGKPSLYKMLMIMTLFQIYEASQGQE
jgi:hypothetical protein